jgi:hypothetical protein
MSYFNDEQMDHMRSLARMAEEGKVCPCGWFTKDECAQRCNSSYGSPEKEAANRALRAKQVQS